MSWLDDFTGYEKILGLLVVVLLAVVIAAASVDYSARKECEESGGRVITDYDRCTTTVICTAHNAGKVSYTTCNPIRNCPWHCEKP